MYPILAEVCVAAYSPERGLEIWFSWNKKCISVSERLSRARTKMLEVSGHISPITIMSA
jgi:hypothetical protein